MLMHLSVMKLQWLVFFAPLINRFLILKRFTQQHPINIKRVLVGVALLAYLLGAYARIRYGLIDHAPRHFGVSDASNMLDYMMTFVSGEQQSRWGTIWPPGQMAFMALMHRIDATLFFAGAIQVLLSLLVPWLVADVARQLCSRRAFWFALALASLHVGLINHVGFFLSESLFQVAMAFAIWLTTTSISFAKQSKSVTLVCVISIMAGCAWGVATYFRPNALPVLLAVVASLVFMASFWRSNRQVLLVALATMLGALIVLAPVAHRCTKLNQHFCPVSSNFAMNVALGQAGEYKGIKFSDTTWVPPALMLYGYTEKATIPYSMFDTKGLLSWVYEKVKNDPLAAMRNATRNGMGIFHGQVWPNGYGNWSRNWFKFGAWGMVFLMLLPGTVGIVRVSHRFIKNPSGNVAPVVAVVGVLSVILLASLSLGEGRYRYPFDIWWISLAALAFWRPDLNYKVMTQARSAAVMCVALFVVSSAVFLGLTFHPDTVFASKLQTDQEVVSATHLIRRAEELQNLNNDEKNKIVLDCKKGCPELMVLWDGEQQADWVDVSVEPNDSYRVTFYKDNKALGFEDTRLRYGQKQLQSKRIKVPASVARFDAVGITPLFGDGRYAVGQVAAHKINLNLDAKSLAKRIHRRSDEVVKVRPAGTAWDRGNTILTCEKEGECSELLVHWTKTQHADWLDISADHNDVYRVVFYGKNKMLAHQDLNVQGSGYGLNQHKVAVPESVKGFDSIGITPLYGDNRYSVGHVIAIAAKLDENFNIVPTTRIQRDADELSIPRLAGTPWHRGTTILNCDVGCSELLVNWHESQQAKWIDISLDNNDAYRVTFYSDGKALSFQDLLARPKGSGLNQHQLEVPKGMRKFDAIGVSPLYGDGSYSVGHVIAHYER